MSERTWFPLTGVGLALIALGWLLPASKVGDQTVRSICIGGGVLLVVVAQFRMIRLPTETPNDEEVPPVQ